MPPLKRSMLSRITLVLLLVAALLTPTLPAHAQDTTDLIETPVSFTNGDRTIGGTIIAPADSATDLPGLVLVAGAGPGPDRDRYREHAEAFARAGIATLIYDKRGGEDGYSQFAASMDDLAGDAIAAAQTLRERPGVDPEIVGLHGHSEGAWVVIEAGSRSDDVAFVIASGGSAFTPDRTQQWMNRVQLYRLGVEDRFLDALGSQLISAIVAADMFRLAGHDPLPNLTELEQPFLGVFSAHDLNTPPAQSLESYREALEAGGHESYSLRVVPGVDHEMVLLDGSAMGAAYVETVSSWVTDLAAGIQEVRVDEPPSQDLESSPAADVQWFGTWTAVLIALVLSVVLFGAYPVMALARRARGFAPMESSRSARLLAVLGLTVPVLAVVYLIMVMMVAGTSVFGPVLAGRPLPWLLLQLAALGIAALAIAVVVQASKRWGDMDTGSKVRFGALVAGTVVVLPWAVYWGLLIV